MKPIKLTEGEFDIAFNVLFGGMTTSEAIENQEKRGQSSFVKSELLPIKLNGCTEDELEQIGIRLGKPVDDLFREAQLPAGWEKVATDHSMWSKVVDEKGRDRIAIFYKAAFYDRSAHLHMNRRFAYQLDYSSDDDTKTAIVTDCGKVIFRTEPLDIVAQRGDAIAALEKSAREWLESNFPSWQDVTQYWD